MGWLVGWGGQSSYFVNAEIHPAIWYRLFRPHWVIQFCSWEIFFIIRVVSCFGLSSVSGGVSSKVRHWQTPSWNGRLLGCLGLKGETRCLAVVSSARSMEAPAVKTE